FFTGIFFLFLAFGDALSLRKWLYYTVPLFDRFRFPSLFRLFALLPLIICSGLGWNRILKEHQNKKQFNVVMMIIALMVLAGIIYSSLELNEIPSLSTIFSWNDFINHLDFD